MIPNPDRLSDQYDRVKTLDLKTNITNWHYDEPIFERLVSDLKPRTYIEVGVHKGASLLRVAKMMRDLHGSAVRCYAVDFWREPGLFDQFLWNVVAAGLDDIIMPMRYSSVEAAPMFAAFNMLADLIYIDAGHTFIDCLADMTAYYPLLRQGGVMFGDDFTEETGVNLAVKAFGQPFTNTYYHWELPPKP